MTPAFAAAIAVVALALPLVLSSAAPAEEHVPAAASLGFDKTDGTLYIYIEWSGPIAAGMADDLRSALGKYCNGLRSRGPLSRLGWWSGRGGRSCDRDPQRDQERTPAHHRGAPWQAVCFPDKSPLFTGTSVVPYVYINKPPTGPDAGKFLQTFVPRSPASSSAGSPAGVEK